MIHIRPVTLEDLEAFNALAIEAGVGMTTLPKDSGLLKEKIEQSIASFKAKIDEPGEQSYLFVMEDPEHLHIVGCCAIYAAVGLSRPFYSFRVINLTHTSQELNKYEPVRALQMVEEYRGNSEIGTLYLSPDWRKNGNGKFLSRSRFLFLAEFADRFNWRIVAEMRGMQDDSGHSVFWQNLGQHFIKMPFSKADYLTSLGKYQFIADLMPKYPVYIRLLPDEAKEVIGKVHEATKPALELLKREGFRYEGCVDVFDAGPTVVCPLKEIRAVQESFVVEIDSVESLVNMPNPGPVYMACNRRLEEFRAVRTQTRSSADNKVTIDTSTANTLNVDVGDEIRLVRF